MLGTEQVGTALCPEDAQEDSLLLDDMAGFGS